MALQSAQSEQQLLYSLRNPTTPLSDKLQQATSALDFSPSSTSLPPLVRDWALDVLLKATRTTTIDSPIVSLPLWRVVARSTTATPSTSTSSPLLPVFVSFLAAYQQAPVDDSTELARAAVSTWSRLAGGTLRKATAEAALDSYDKLLAASAVVMSTEREKGRNAAEVEEERRIWEQLVVVWLKALKGAVLEGGKGGKKVPTHTLSILPKLLPLLALLPPTSPMRLVLLDTVQFALFNLDNLRRGLARETYAAGSAGQAANLTADTELLAALSPLLPSIASSIFAALPSFTVAYLSALSTNSAILFPLSAKANFPTPSAQKSALEVLGLTKRRELAGKWVKGVVELLGWAGSPAGDEMALDVAVPVADEREKAAALAGVLAEIERNDLYRAGAADGWEAVFSTIVAAASTHLRTAAAHAATRDALLQVLAVVGRLSYDLLEPALPAVLAMLSSVPSSTSPSSTSNDFLFQLITHHSRSMTVPSLLTLLAEALASPFGSSASPRPANNLLTTYPFFHKLGQAVSGLGASASARVAYETLSAAVRCALQPTAVAVEEVNGEMNEDDASPAKKRRLSPAPDATPYALLSAASHLRILSLFISSLPPSALPALVDPLEALVVDLVEPPLKDFVKLSQRSVAAAAVGESEEGTPSKKEKKKRRKSGLLPVSGEATEVAPEARLAAELLEVRYAALERLNREELLGVENGEKWWVLKEKRRKGLLEVVEGGRAEFAVVAARTLLQHVELERASDDEAQAILKSVVDRVATAKDGVAWSSFLRDIKEEEGSVALWELLSRRWLGLAEIVAADAQLDQLVQILLAGISQTASSSDLTRAGSTTRLLHRADFWELQRIQGLFQTALLAQVTLPSLASPAPLLVGDTPTLTAIRSLPASTLLSAIGYFRAIAATIPLEYLTKATREQLTERALALDVCISTDVVVVGADEKQRAQIELRQFVALLGSSVSGLSPILFRLFEPTLPAARSATLDLFRSLVQNALSHSKTSSSPYAIVTLLASFGDEPLAKLAKRAKKNGVVSLTTEESAFLFLIETLSTSLPPLADLPSDLQSALQAPTKSALKSFDKVVPLVSTALSKKGGSFFLAGDILDATRSIWAAKEWMRVQDAVSLDVFGSFTELALRSALAQLPSVAASPSASSAALSLLNLLSYRIQRPQPQVDDASSTTSFEIFVACHLAFRHSLPSQAREQLNANLVRCVASVSLPEYSAALNAVAAFVGVIANRDVSSSVLDEIEQALDVALVLLRDGPDGSSRLASSALSDLLRHVSLLTESVEQGVSGEVAVRTYLLAARFLEGVCADKPMLLSRLNISNTLSLVCRLLQPTSAASPSPQPAATQVGDLYRTLVTVVTLLVRHRKDHIVPLFPLLVSTISSFTSILRRAGFGTTGSDLAIDEIDLSVALGHRAEREARTTFPSWVWEGGAKGIGRLEARSLGRLLGALTTKTTSQTVKRKKDASAGGEDGPTTTTSLVAPLSKHAPFLLLTYLRACVHATCPIPSALRSELQGGWFEVMDSVGKWEKEALMKGFLGEDEEAERGVLRTMFKVHDSTRYHG